MAKVALICLYDNWALGLRALSNALLSNGHDVAVIHLKLPCQKRLEDFLRHPVAYENLQTRQSHSEVILTGYNMDVNMWTPNECGLLGDCLLDLNADIIGLTTRTLYEKYLNPIVEQIERSTATIKLVGGFGASMNPVFYTDKFDYVCVGEGEETIVKMAQYVDEGLKNEIRHLPNLVYKLSGQVVRNKMEKPDDTKDYFYNPRMGEIPHYVIENNMIGKTDVFIEYVRKIDPTFAGLNNYYTMVGRGCMWDCSFCVAGKFYQLYKENGTSVKRRRNRKIETIIDELKLAKEHGFSRIYFMDSFLVGEEQYLLKFFDLYEKEVNIPFFAQLFPDQILKSPEILEKAVQAGLISTVAGIQSGSESVRNKILNRNETNETILKFANMVSSYSNVFLEYHIITHNPLETIEDIKEALDLIVRLPKKNAQMMLLRLRPFSGSAISNMIQQANLGNVNEEFNHKVFMLYLIRYHVPNDEFEKIFANLDRYSHIDLKNLYVEIKKKYKGSSDWIRVGLEYHNNGKYGSAIEAFNSALELDPLNYRALNGRGWSFRQENRHIESIMDFNNALKYIPLSERDALQEAWRGLGWSYFCKTDYPAAINSFNNAMKFCGTSERIVLQDILRGLGWSHHHKKEFSKSGGYFSKAIENIDTNNVDVMQDALNGLSLARQENNITA